MKSLFVVLKSSKFGQIIAFEHAPYTLKKTLSLALCKIILARIGPVEVPIFFEPGGVSRAKFFYFQKFFKNIFSKSFLILAIFFDNHAPLFVYVISAPVELVRVSLFVLVAVFFAVALPAQHFKVVEVI